MNSRETFLQADDNVDSKEENVEAMINEHEDFDKAIGNQEEKIVSLQIYADPPYNLSNMLVMTSIK